MIPQRWSTGEYQNFDRKDIRDSEVDIWVTCLPEAGREQSRAQEDGQSHREMYGWKENEGGDCIRSSQRGVTV